jgi:hypothetical protein
LDAKSIPLWTITGCCLRGRKERGERERKIQSETKEKREVVLLDQLDSHCLRRGGAVELN